jgi:hypothetical protein
MKVQPTSSVLTELGVAEKESTPEIYTSATSMESDMGRMMGTVMGRPTASMRDPLKPLKVSSRVRFSLIVPCTLTKMT